MKYYAHTNGPDPSKWQLLKHHLVRVEELAGDYAKAANPSDATLISNSRLAGRLHDLGKYTDAFQKMLLDAAAGRPIVRSPHSIYGAALAAAHRKYDVALAIMGHHSGLHNASELRSKIRGAEAEAQRLSKERAQKIDGLNICMTENNFDDNPRGTSGGVMDLYLRMLFSCLIDADRSNCLECEIGRLDSWPELNPKAAFDRLMAHINECASRPASPSVKNARKEVLCACLDAAQSPQRLFSLAVPTGGGKTLSSMAFALKRALERPYEVRRVIVVMPFLSIIEQNAAVLRMALGDDMILEHHSGDLWKSNDFEQGAAQQMSEARIVERATENWEAPVVVTTTVRFFESLYSNRPSDLRRLHNIAHSVVILDEAQVLPKGFLGTLLSMMGGLSRDWGVTFVISTATQPAFEKQRVASADDMRWESGTIRPILAPDAHARISQSLKRVNTPTWPRHDDRLSWHALSQMLLEDRRALCIVNTKQQAADLYHLVMSQAENQGLSRDAFFHLSARMCPFHRMNALKDIHERMANDKAPCIVVSTQVVEAGVDLDFPAVYRAMGPLDAIIQAAGRCDRNGHRTETLGKPGGKFVVFEPETDQSPYPDATQITRGLASRGSLDIHNADHMKAFYNELYEGDRDPNDIEGLRRRLDFPRVNERFAMIADNTKAVLVPYCAGAQKTISAILRSKAMDREALRESQKYQVGLYPHEFEEAKKLGTVVELWHGSDFWQAKESCYDRKLGLIIKVPAPEDLLVCPTSADAREEPTAKREEYHDEEYGSCESEW